jgi:hypothetical protein
MPWYSRCTLRPLPRRRGLLGSALATGTGSGWSLCQAASARLQVALHAHWQAASAWPGAAHSGSLRLPLKKIKKAPYVTSGIPGLGTPPWAAVGTRGILISGSPRCNLMSTSESKLLIDPNRS